MAADGIGRRPKYGDSLRRTSLHSSCSGFPSSYGCVIYNAQYLLGEDAALPDESDVLQMLEDVKCVSRKGIVTMQQRHSDYLISGDYNKETFRLDDFPFVFHTPDHCRALLGKAGIQICLEVASDGASELLQDLVNSLDEASYPQYLRYHFYICEKPEFLGMSNHLLFVGR